MSQAPDVEALTPGKNEFVITKMKIYLYDHVVQIVYDNFML